MAKKIAKKASKAAPVAPLESPDPVFEYTLEKGPVRPFVVTTPPPFISTARASHLKNEKILIAGLILFAVVVRFHQLGYPNLVVFDEVHFGGFARKYILGNFFMDVHPPLAKMLYAGVGYIFGFNGSFEFKNIGDIYPPSVPYIGMRALPAALGVGTVVFSYLTLRASGCRIVPSLLTAVLLTLENANTTLSRYILLDLPLVFFIAALVYLLKRFENEIPFSAKWYKALIVGGVGLGCAVSSKWVGLFTIAWAGCYMAWQMWFVLGDLTVGPTKVLHHAVARASILLGIPALLYCFFFAVHFLMLPNEGDGGAFMSLAFRTTLNGNTIPRVTNSQVGVGSIVTIRHVKTQGGYLHLHDHMYETGSKQQQITLYPHLDENNEWLIELYNETEAPTLFRQIVDGTKIRLKHKVTLRRLHLHNHRPPMLEQDWQNEASCYGFEGFDGDANDDFIVEIDKPLSKKGVARSELRAIDTVFRLRHAMTGCYLFSHEVKLPKYAFEQQEVTCATQGIKPLSYWYIEVNENPFLNATSEKVSYKTPSFWDKLVESHQRMWHINNGLTASHNWELRPPLWPLLQRGINYWVKDKHQVYLLGNAVTWWALSAVVFIYVCNLAALAINWQRGKPLITDPHFVNFNVQTLIFVGGWALHYFPSFLMGRQLFLHHYVPALYFQILALGQTFDLVYTYFAAKKPVASYVVFAIFALASASFFYNFSPLIWGGDWTKGKCKTAKILSTWDFDCNAFPELLLDYLSQVVPEVPVATSTPDFKVAAPVGGAVHEYQDENGNKLDPKVAEEYIKQHPEEVLKVETKLVASAGN